MSEVRTSVLGGEAGRRGLFGTGRNSQSLEYVAGTFITMCVLYVIYSTYWIFIVGTPIMVYLFFATRPTSSGTGLTKLNRRRRMFMRRILGSDQFIPYTEEEWKKARSTKGWLARRRAMGYVRQMPDFFEGFGWLQSAPKVTGILWHKPSSPGMLSKSSGQGQFASMVFEVEGKISGMESQEHIDIETDKWCRFLEGFGAESSLAKRIQTVTRVLPPDTTPHESWVGANLDDDVPVELHQSYADALEDVAGGSLIQRHYVVISWPIDKVFMAAAERYGKDRYGWRRLLEFEGLSAYRSLLDAGMGDAVPLTARQITAILAHLQDPARLIDEVRGMDPTNFGIPSRDTKGYTVTTAPNTPFSLDVDNGSVRGNREWFHATGLLKAEDFEVKERCWDWLRPFLSNLGEPVIRTLSFHMEIVPSYQAKAEARKDFIMDEAELRSKSERGRLAADETEVSREAASRRMEELRAGSGHHGVRWVGAVTISALSTDDLRRQKRLMTELVQSMLGVRRLHWLDSQQSGALGLTAPLGRGLSPRRASVLDKVESTMETVDSKEAFV